MGTDDGTEASKTARHHRILVHIAYHDHMVSDICPFRMGLPSLAGMLTLKARRWGLEVWGSLLPRTPPFLTWTGGTPDIPILFVIQP